MVFFIKDDDMKMQSNQSHFDHFHVSDQGIWKVIISKKVKVKMSIVYPR